MDRAITLLARRVDDLREAGAAREGASEVILAELAAIRTGLAEASRNERSGERFKVVESGIDALGRKIDLLGARAVDPVEVARLQGQMSEMRDLVQRPSARPRARMPWRSWRSASAPAPTASPWRVNRRPSV